jgi:transcriptional regulator with XRE-family HTH domain
VVSKAYAKKHEMEGARTLLALNVLRLRSQRGWSQEALAHESGLHRTFIAHVERQARNASIDNIERIAFALGVEVAQLFLKRSHD